MALEYLLDGMYDTVFPIFAKNARLTRGISLSASNRLIFYHIQNMAPER